MNPIRDSGSFRDPSGYVHEHDGKIVRSVRKCAVADFDAVSQTGFFDFLTRRRWLVETTEIDPYPFKQDDPEVERLLHHERIPFISYPYEWPFAALKAAALLQLDIHIEALKHGVTLSDATAYNIQFRGAQPVFIDILSLRPYRDKEIWAGHRQFCEQFLNPLLLNALFGIPHNAWFRGSLEGVPTQELARLLKWRHLLSWNVLTHVKLQSGFQKNAIADESGAVERAKQVELQKISFVGILTGLRNWISKLQPYKSEQTTWSDYVDTHTYSSSEEAKKRELVTKACKSYRPELLVDIGCNTGEYSQVALNAGAGQAVGFEADHGALNLAFQRAQEENLNFLPLYQDFANPSPSQGWLQSERKGIAKRAKVDFVLALAVEHHLAIGRNIPLDEVIGEIVKTAPRGIIEFVEKSDPTVQRMLKLRKDIFPEYSAEAFKAALGKFAVIEHDEQISQAGRTLYLYKKTH